MKGCFSSEIVTSSSSHPILPAEADFRAAVAAVAHPGSEDMINKSKRELKTFFFIWL
jgi:alpha-D-ribose 1-methylphosphonate 5-triphosphate synthase subunit PhnH